MGWEALGHWGEDAARIEPLAGGVANDVWSVRVQGTLRSVVSVRGATLISGGRPSSSNTSTMKVCLTVPVPIPTTGGRRVFSRRPDSRVRKSPPLFAAPDRLPGPEADHIGLLPIDIR